MCAKLQTSLSAGSDLEMLSQVLTFSSGALIGDSQCADITILNDNDVECDDVFNVTLTTTDSNVDIAEGYGMATVTIERDAADGENVTVHIQQVMLSRFDNDFVVITIGLNQSNYFASETVGSVMVCAEIIAMTGTLESDVEVTLTTSDGTATGL